MAETPKTTEKTELTPTERLEANIAAQIAALEAPGPTVYETETGERYLVTAPGVKAEPIPGPGPGMFPPMMLPAPGGGQLLLYPKEAQAMEFPATPEERKYLGEILGSIAARGGLEAGKAGVAELPATYRAYQTAETPEAKGKIIGGALGKAGRAGLQYAGPAIMEAAPDIEKAVATSLHESIERGRAQRAAQSAARREARTAKQASYFADIGVGPSAVGIPVKEEEQLAVQLLVKLGFPVTRQTLRAMSQLLTEIEREQKRTARRT
jgi:hypothetical protein